MMIRFGKRVEYPKLRWLPVVKDVPFGGIIVIEWLRWAVVIANTVKGPVE